MDYFNSLFKSLAVRPHVPKKRPQRTVRRTPLLGGGGGTSKMNSTKRETSKSKGKVNMKAGSEQALKRKSSARTQQKFEMEAEKSSSDVGGVQELFLNAHVQCKDFYTSKKTGKRVFKWRNAEIIEVGSGRVKISYDGFASRWDEWITFSSHGNCRIRGIDGCSQVSFEGEIYSFVSSRMSTSVGQEYRNGSGSRRFSLDSEPVKYDSTRRRRSSDEILRGNQSMMNGGKPMERTGAFPNSEVRRNSRSSASGARRGRRESKEEISAPRHLVNNTMLKSKSQYHLKTDNGNPSSRESHQKKPNTISKVTNSKSQGNIYKSSSDLQKTSVFTRPRTASFDLLSWVQAYRVTRSKTDVVGGVVGLTNLGNTCYLNAVVQCLGHIAPLVQYFVQNPSRYKQEVNTQSATKGELASSFSELLLQQWSADSYDEYRVQSTQHSLKACIESLSTQFQGYEQHDAQELYTVLLDGLHQDLSRIRVQPRYEEIKERKGMTETEKSNLWWKNYEERNDSIFKDLFCGQLQSKVRCDKCGHTSTSYDPFWELSVPIPSDDASDITLQSCLREFTTVERLRGAEKYYCQSCKKHRNCSKIIGVFRCPIVLVVHLKRTRPNCSDKVNTAVQFPVENLDMKEFCTNPESFKMSGIWYDLICVVNHHGKSTTSGHYTADCFNPDDWKWYRYDDREVSAISPKYLSPDHGYLLFYIRRTW